MSEALSKRLLDSYQTRARGPHMPYSTYQHESISSHGQAPFNPTMHGSYHPQDAFSCAPDDSAFFNLSADTEAKLATLQAKLNQKLGPEYISTRPGGGGMKLTYTEGWKVINLANEVFGFNGWSTAVVNVTCDFADYDPNTQRYTVGIAAIVRVTLRDGVYHEDTGYGMMENSKSKGAAFDKCRKEAVTDALKRALRNFGNLLGNCLYDKEYTKEIQKIKPPPPPKLDKDLLHRRPEFVEQKPNPKPAAGPSSINQNDGQNQNTNHHHASTSNDQLSGNNTSVSNRPAQSDVTTNAVSKPKITPPQNNSRPTPNTGNAPTNVYKPPPPKNPPANVPPVAGPKQQQQQEPAVKPDATTSMDVDYMAGEDDMTFFESEDEKWMMGEFDNDLDVDLGRPIAFEADESVTNQDDSGFQDANNFSVNADPRKGTSANGNNNAAQGAGGSNLANPNNNAGTGNGNKEASFQPPPKVRFAGNGDNRGQHSTGSTVSGTGNGNGNNGSGSKPNLSNPTGSGSNRPSAGGFTFPPGVNPSGIGSKRPAESMLQHPQQQPGGSGFRRVSSGMGLSAMPTNGNNRNGLKREPLGNIFVGGEGGGGAPDPKRMRR